MSDEKAKDLEDANEKVVQDMLRYAAKIHHTAVPNEATTWITKILRDSGPLKNFSKYLVGSSNQVVEVKYSFSGKTREMIDWEALFTISADVANQARQQSAHLGCDVSVNKKRVGSTHKWLPKDSLAIGRPETFEGQPLEQFPTGHEHIDFDGGAYADWNSTSRKYP